MRFDRRVRACGLPWQLVLASLILPTAGAGSARGDDSPIRIDPSRVNFFQVPRGQTVDVRVRMVNVSDRHIRIKRVVPECECLGVSINGPTSMRPSGVLELNLTYATMREPAGVSEKKIFIEYQDARPKKLSLPVRIDIQPGVIYEPSMLSFGRLGRGESRTLEIDLHTPDQSPFAIGGVESSHPDVLRTDRSREVHGRLRKHHRVRVTLGPIESPGRFAGSVVLFTQHWSDQELEIPVFADVVGLLTVEPSTVYRGKVSPGAVVHETLTLGGGAVEVSALRVVAESDILEQLSPELVPVEGRSDQVVLRLSVPGDFSGTHLSGTLALRAGQDQEPLARLSVFLYLPPRAGPE